MKARVIVTLKPACSTRKAKRSRARLNARPSSLRSVRQGKVFDIELDGEDRAAARRTLSEACERLLANTIVEDYAIEIAKPSMRAAVDRLSRLNREGDVARALRQASGAEPRIVWHADRDCRRGRISLCCRADFPTGIICVAARSPRARRSCGRCAITQRAADWCSASATASRSCARPSCCPGVLMRNADRRFICKMQHLRVENAQTPFTRGYRRGQVVKFAIAHGEGNFVADEEPSAAIEADGRVAFRYCDAEGRFGDSPIRTDRPFPSPACSTSSSTCSG